MAERRQGQLATPTETSVRAADWYGDDISGQTHTRVAFRNCMFTACSFFDATFERCTFGLMTVTGGNWSFVGLPGAKLGGASFAEAT